MGFYISDPKTY
jgi:hypothetical protein